MSARGLSRRPQALLIVLVVLAGHVGCATRLPLPVGVEPMSPPPSPSVRARLGTVGVASGQFTPAVSLTGPPAGRGAGAARGLALGAELGVRVGALCGMGVIICGPALAIVAAPIGALVGAARAEPATDVQAKHAALESGVGDLAPRLHAMLRERVVLLGRERALRTLSPLPDHGPSAPIQRVDYRDLAGQGIATVLEVRVVGFGLHGEWHLQGTIQPAVSCIAGARTRLLRTADGKTLYESTMAYRGAARPLEEWIADGAARFREEVQGAVGWIAEQVVDQVFLRVAPPEDTLRVRVRPAALGDIEARLLGDDGLLRGIQRFDAEFEGLTLEAEEGRRLRALLREVARAPWDSELTLEGTIDGAPFTIEIEKDNKGRVKGQLEGLLFDDPAEARAFVESFVETGPLVRLKLDGYASGRRLRVTFGPEGLVVTDRGAGVPKRRVDDLEPDDALKVRVLPASLEDVRGRLVGERGLVTREQRFEAEFEDLTLAVEDVEPLVDLLRAALHASPRSELKLGGMLEGLPFKAKLAIDRDGRARLGLEGFVFASEQDVDRFLARFEGADTPLEMTVVGSVAGQKLRRTRQLDGVKSAPPRSPHVAPPQDPIRVRVRPATLGDLEARLLGDDGLLQGARRFDVEFEGLTLDAEEGRRLRALLRAIARAPRGSELTLEGTIDGAPFTIELEKDDRGRLSGSFEGLVFDHPDEARDFIGSFVPAGPRATLRLDGYAEGQRLRVTLGLGGVAVVDRGAGVPARRTDTVKPDDALKVRVLPATLALAREKLLGKQGLVTRGQRFEAEFEALALAVKDVEPLVDLLRAALRARPRSELELDGTLGGGRFKAKLTVDREGRGRLGLEGFLFASEQDVDQFIARFASAEGLRELTLVGTVAGQKLRRTWQPGSARPAASHSP